MTTIALLASGLHNSKLTSALASLGRSISTFFSAIDEGRAMAARYDALAALSDAELAKLGLKRSEIARLAIFGKFRKAA